MADYCNARSNGGCSATSMGTFRPGPPTMAGYHHNTLTRTTKIGGNLAAADIKERVGTIDACGQRVRIVRLMRPQGYSHGHFNGGGNFGFSIRGGLEYGTGFFVSAVEQDSEADRQGLRVGDQLIRVNGYQVDDAVHRELAQFVSCQERLVLKVRSVGILPVKERSADPLTWHVVSVTTNSGPVASNVHTSTNGSSSTKKHQLRAELERTSCSSSNSSTSTGSSGTIEELPGGRELKVILSVAPRTKLGCGICKGPDWKPGIFVQFTKEGGVAREAGLRPGDQIMSCNGREFAEITFAEAVSIMKASQVLELVVRPGAGIDMFPGESSGYNSSASSVNGDQSPCWGDSTAKRLSIVREESISKDRRAGQQKKVAPTTTANGHRRNNTTIIEFSENGTVVNSTLISGDGGKRETNEKDGSKKLADICFVSKQSETKTVIVEVHRSASTNSIVAGCPNSASSGNSTASSGSSSNIPPPPPLFADKIPPPPPPSNGFSSGYSTTNSVKSGGLGTIGGQQQQRSLSSVSLADSSASSGIDCGSIVGGIGGLGNAISEELKRRAEKKGTLLSSAAEPAAALTELENRLKEKRFRPPNSGSDAARHSALMDEFRAVHKRMFKNGFDNAEIKKSSSKDKLPIEVRPPGATATPPNQQNSSASASGGSQSKGTMGRVAASELAKANGDIAELESIESFQMTNPQPAAVRPPSYYFCPQNTGPATMKKSQKPIAVTISEYIGTNADQAKKPTRIDFGSAGVGDSIGSLKYELEKTLSLSNLRQRSESREDLVERIQIGCGQPEQMGKLCRSSSVANVVSRSGSSATTVSNGNRITIAISNGADKK